MAGSIERVRASDPATQRFADDVTETLNPLFRLPILNGRLIEGTVLASGDNSISHGLGRKLLGWIPVRCSAAVDLYDKQGTNTVPDKLLVLNASADVTVSLWVF